MKKRLVSILLAGTMVLSLAACGGDKGGGEAVDADVPSIDEINGDDYKDLEADIKILTNRTDVVDTVYKGYADQFMEKYPNIKVTYEGITDYEESLTLRLTTGDWGDICFIPSTTDKSELGEYFTPMGSYDKLNETYRFVTEKTFEGTVYGIPNGGVANGVVYNKRIWDKAGIKELPTTPDEFLDDLKLIADKTDAIPLYTNFSAGWTMGAWNDYVGNASNADPDFKNNKLLHSKDPFTKNDNKSGPYAVYYTLYEAVARDLVEEDPASSDWESPKRMLNDGEIASMVLGSWSAQQCMDVGDHPEDVGYMPFPITVGDKRTVGSGGNYSYGINNKSSEDNQIASMLYIKWLVEESPIFEDEGSIPALKSADLPEVLSGLDGVEFLADNAPQEGEEDLYDSLRSTADVLSGDYPPSNVLEAALYETKTLDELMAEWDEQWTNAQESLGVEVTE